MSKVYMAEANVIDGLVLHEIIEAHYNDKVERYQYLYRLYKGEHDILETVQPDPLKPDNKLVNNYFGEIVDTIVGYFLGNPITITSEDEEIEEALYDILDSNDIDDVFMEVGKEGSIKGTSALLVYQNEESETVIVRLPADEVIFIYDASRPSDLLYAIRVYEMAMVDQEEKVRYAEVYSKQNITYWVQDSETGIFIPDENRDDEPHIFNRVPVVEVANNMEKMGDFEKIITLVNDFDKVFSNASNELEAYRNAYLMIKNMAVDSTTIKKLREDGIIEVLENGDVKFVTKDVNTAFMKEHLDRLQDNIYRFSQVPNLSDENFASNLSGVAIRFKLFGLETKCIAKERKFTKAIKDLLKILAEPIRVMTGKQLELKHIEIQFSRNVPNNLVELADVVSKLNGVVDKQTLIGLLPFVDDPKAVEEALKKEQDVYAKDMQKLMSGGEDATMAQNPSQQVPE